MARTVTYAGATIVARIIAAPRLWRANLLVDRYGDGAGATKRADDMLS